MYPWHANSYHQLTDAFLSGRGHHALLFKTEPGLGTEQLILHFAQWLFCLEKQGREPCGQCKSCLLWQSGNHPDFHRIEPIENKDIGIDQIRELTEKLQRFSQQGGNSVIYLRSAERLTEAAANALLKTLEEPHDNVYFLLEAPLNTAMLATIQSRCQMWLLHTPAESDAFHWLKAECPSYPDSDLHTALRLNHYRPLQSKFFLETDRLSARKTFLQTFWRFFKSHDVWLMFSAFEKEKEAALQQLEWLESFFRDAIKSQMGIASGWINPDLSKGIVPFAQTIPPLKLLNGQKIITQTALDLQAINAVNQELILLDGLTKLVVQVFQ